MCTPVSQNVGWISEILDVTWMYQLNMVFVYKIIFGLVDGNPQVFNFM